MPEQTILELKQTLRGEVQQFRCRLLTHAPGEAVVLFEHDQERCVADVVLPVGTVTFGYFWAERPYNAYHWVAPSGKTLGIYFNVSDGTRVEQDRILWRDLVVDVLVTPNGQCRVMDEDEIPADIDPALLGKINEARDHIVVHRAQLFEEIEARTQMWAGELLKGSGS